MPKAFDDCYKSGGKIITKKVNSAQYIHICYTKAGKAVPGTPKKYKSTMGK